MDRPLPALSARHNKRSILKSIMDTDAGALLSLDIDPPSFGPSAVCLRRVVVAVLVCFALKEKTTVYWIFELLIFCNGTLKRTLMWN